MEYTDYDSIYDKSYYLEYNDGRGYQNVEFWRPLFEHFADHIISRFQPKTFLDVGCAYGYLVAELRRRGVQAYGIDVSSYAISQTAPDIKAYCAVASVVDGQLPDGFPTRFDLVSCVEVLEHLHEEDSDAAIRTLCSLSDLLLISACPTDDGDTTHVNTQPPTYWFGRFAQLGFYSATAIDVSFLTDYAICLYKATSPIGCVVAAYNDSLTQTSLAAKTFMAKMEILADETSAFQYQCAMSASLAKDNEARWQTRYLQIENTLAQMRRSIFWRVGAPFRFTVRKLKWAAKRIPGIRYIYSVLACIKNSGLRELGPQMRNRRFLLQHFKGKSQQVTHFLPVEALRWQVENYSTDSPIISVIVPLYNTPAKYLREMLDSVLNQTYPKWELCLADGSDERHLYVGKIARQYARRHGGIRYQKLEKNAGIAGNTNEALQMATGDYIAVLDHDDLLAPHALFTIVQAIRHENADVLYTDEAAFRDNPHTIENYILKPDYAPDTLRTCNYMCHFLVYRRSLSELIGEYDSTYDGAQDYDYIFRLTEATEKVVHISQILYYWRIHAGSVALSIDVKPYATVAGRNAVAAHIARLGYNGRVSYAEDMVGFYHVSYALTSEPLVSIIIPCFPNEGGTVSRCVASIREKSSYKNYEILVAYADSQSAFSRENGAFGLQTETTRVLYLGSKNTTATLCNEAIRQAQGSQLLFMSAGTEVIATNLVQELLALSQRQDVGAVGAKLYSASDTVYSAGIVVGLCGVAGHLYRGFSRSEIGHLGYLKSVHNMSAVTLDGMMIKKETFELIGGLDPLYGAYADIHLCLSLLDAGYKNIVVPPATLYYHPPILTVPQYSGADILAHEEQLRRRWADFFSMTDPFYNRHFRMDTEACLVNPNLLPLR